MGALDDRVAERAARHLPLAVAILREAVRIPADYVDRSVDEGGDPRCGLSNHEGPRLQFLRDTIVDIGAVERAEDAGFDEMGNLVWSVEDGHDGVAPDEKRVILMDGHSDTVQALRAQWHQKLGGAVDPYDGLVDGAGLDESVLRAQLGWVPPREEWGHLVFGRGSADQLGGVVAQIIATKILLELRDEGALRGSIVRGYATVAEEDNDGAAPRHVVQKLLPGAPPSQIPDVVILTEGTGDAIKGALGIYRGQRGRMQIEVEVHGRSCHGSMPFEGLNPLEFGAAIITQAAARHEQGDGFLDHDVLGRGTRTASWSMLDTPSHCAVPERFTLRFYRRLTVGETAESALQDIESLPGVAAARAAGLEVAVRAPHYHQATWTGHVVENAQVYPGWLTPQDHPAIEAAVAAYRGVVTPNVHEPEGGARGGTLRAQPRVDRWIFSTDGVGFPLPAAQTEISVPATKRWVVSRETPHPAMFGVGPGIEQNTHRIGEHIDERELQHAIALLARFPSAYVAATSAD